MALNITSPVSGVARPAARHRLFDAVHAYVAGHDDRTSRQAPPLSSSAEEIHAAVDAEVDAAVLNERARWVERLRLLIGRYQERVDEARRIGANAGARTTCDHVILNLEEIIEDLTK